MSTLFLEAVQSGPLQQEISCQSCRAIIVQYLQGQREVELKLALHFISQLGPLVDGCAPALVEEGQLAGQFIVGFPSLEPIAMAIEQFTDELGVGPIIFGAPGTKSLPKAGQLTGIDQIEFQELVAHQMIDQSPSTLLQTDQNFTFSSKALLQLTEPVHQSIELVSDALVLDFGRLRGGAQNHVMFLIRPIDPYIGRNPFGRSR